MYAFFQELTNIALPVFVIATMFNVGLTQKPSAITDNLRDWHFLIRMLFANFIIVPSLVSALVNLAGDYEPAQSAGPMIMSVCAGAPFLIKLTQTSENDIALSATMMMVLMVSTVIIVWLLSRNTGGAGEEDSDRGDNRIFVDQRYMQAGRARRPRIIAADSPMSSSARA